MNQFNLKKAATLFFQTFTRVSILEFFLKDWTFWHKLLYVFTWVRKAKPSFIKKMQRINIS